MKSVVAFILVLLIVNRDSKRASWYTVRFQSLCDELERNVAPEQSSKYGTGKAYRIRQQRIAGDTLCVSFDFISNCCETHTGTASVANDTLLLEYYRTGTATCRCVCDYRLTYSITDTTKTWRVVKINRLEKKVR